MSKKSPKDAYEQSDARIKPLTIGVLVLAGLCILSIAIVSWMMNSMSKSDAKAQKPPFFVRDERWQAPKTQLEVHPSKNYATFKAEQEEIMNQYAWIDEDQKIIRIPVNQAMAVIARRGLAARNGNYKDAGKALIPQESGSISESRL